MFIYLNNSYVIGLCQFLSFVRKERQKMGFSLFEKELGVFGSHLFLRFFRVQEKMLLEIYCFPFIRANLEKC